MAAAETARLIASLELQDRNFTRGIRDVERGVDRVDKKLSAFGGFVNRNLGRAIDTLASRGVSALAGTISEASGLNEEITKSQAVFGRASDEVIRFSETTATALGLSQRESLAATGNFGNMFKTIGLGDDASADMSQRMVTLAADMASFNNESPVDMLERLRSGLAGEAEPLRRFGVLLSAARVQEEAYATGIAKRGEALTEQQKVQARYNLILKDTAVQQGDVAKTGNNLAGQQRKLRAMFKDISATVGTELLPVVTELTAEFVKLLQDPASKNAIRSFAKDLGAGAKELLGFARRLPWKEIGDSLKLAGTGARAVADAFLSMPPWVQAAVLTGWGLNKISGGFIGNLASGLIKGVLGMNAGVVNIKAGLVNGGGVPGAGGAGGRLAGAGRLLAGVTGVGIVAGLASEFEDEIQGLSEQLASGWRSAVKDAVGVSIPTISPRDIEWPFGPKNTPTILPEVFGGNGLLGGTGGAPTKAVTGGDRPSPGNPGEAMKVLNSNTKIIAANTARTAAETAAASQRETVELVGLKAGLAAQTVQMTIGQLGQALRDSQQQASIDKVTSTVLAQGQQATTQLIAQRAATVAQTVGDAVGRAGQAVRDYSQLAATGRVATAATNAGTRAANAEAVGASRIVSAIWAARPVINTTTIQQRNTVVNSYGPTGGSSTTNRIPGSGR